MKRRTYLATTGTVVAASLAGCGGILGGPKYDPESVTREDLLLTESAFPSGWREIPNVNPSYRVFGNDDETILVGLDAHVHDDEEGAEDQFDKVRSGYADPNDYPIGDAAFWAVENDEIAYLFLRDSNALGVVIAMKESGLEVQPDQSRAQHYGEAMHEHWQTVAGGE